MFNYMKKLLLLLFSLMLSFNSYGEWTPLSVNLKGDVFYLDLERTNEKDGNVYYWYMKDMIEPIEGYMSGNTYIQGDCVLNRFKELSTQAYLKPMGEIISDSYTDPNPQWDYYPPNTVGESLLDIVCGLEEAYKESYEAYEIYVAYLLEYSRDEILPGME
jgi:hypothetical protein